MEFSKFLDQGKSRKSREAARPDSMRNRIVLVASGLVMWRSVFSFPVDIVRLAAVVHASAAVAMILIAIVHVYAAIWTKGTIRAMWYGTVTRAWAKQHHRVWYRQVTGK